MIQLVYFARLREELGIDRESIRLPDEVSTVGDLREWLGTRGGTWRRELVENPAVCVALNHDYASNDDTIKAGDELAFFPPVTGG